MDGRGRASTEAREAYGYMGYRQSLGCDSGDPRAALVKPGEEVGETGSGGTEKGETRAVDPGRPTTDGSRRAWEL
jgi:hypothetical protein